MKYLLLFIIAGLLNINSFAQKVNVIHASKQVNALANLANITATTGLTSYKQTAYGDTVYMTHIASSDTVTLYYLSDSGFVAGMDAYGDQGFAERYDFSGADSTVKVIGVIARFGGSVTPSSTKTVTFKVWNAAQKAVSVRPTLFNSGLPGTILASKSAKFTELGVSSVDTVSDSAKLFLFPFPTPFLMQSFFIGYTVYYTWGNGMTGDTVGLYSNKKGERTAPSYTVYSTEDTTINNLNVTQYADNSWHDNAVDNFEISNNLYIFPVIVVGATVTGVASGIQRKDFTFYGSYPNPANNSVTIKMALAKNTDVSIEIMDINGNIIRTIKQDNLQAGEHNIPVETSAMAEGDYIYLIRTGSGDGVASKMTIIK